LVAQVPRGFSKRSPAERSKPPQGFTLVEILAAVCILAILAGLVFYGYQPALDKAQSVLCMSRMRSIHAALAANLADKGSWPQPPEFPAGSTGLQSWWIDQLKPQGLSPQNWLCPTSGKIFGQQPGSPEAVSSYSVSFFDSSPSAPYKWATQPWLLEVAGIHPQGPHVCFPDGSIKNMNSLLNR
jgi:prepilin-type N-terminal cleavage/methylation domain-containing protein